MFLSQKCSTLCCVIRLFWYQSHKDISVERTCLDLTPALFRHPYVFILKHGGVDSRHLSNKGRCRIKVDVVSRQVSNQGRSALVLSSFSSSGTHNDRNVHVNLVNWVLHNTKSLVMAVKIHRFFVRQNNWRRQRNLQREIYKKSIAVAWAGAQKFILYL